jgi:hypothetical protein
LALDTVAPTAPAAAKFSLKAIYSEVVCKAAPAEEFKRMAAL